MKYWLAAAFGVLLASPLVAFDGDPSMHHPSTIVQHEGRFYAIGTGAGLPVSVSEDGCTCIDDGVSKRLMKKGANVIRGAIVNAGGATTPAFACSIATTGRSGTSRSRCPVQDARRPLPRGKKWLRASAYHAHDVAEI